MTEMINKFVMIKWPSFLEQSAFKYGLLTGRDGDRHNLLVRFLLLCRPRHGPRQLFLRAGCRPLHSGIHASLFRPIFLSHSKTTETLSIIWKNLNIQFFSIFREAAVFGSLL